MEREVSDPIGQSREIYRERRNQIRAALPRLLDLVLRSTHDETLRHRPAKKWHIAADTDEHRAQGTGPFLARPERPSVRGLGRHAGRMKLPTGLRRPSRMGRSSTGIVIDRTGFGLSISANKIPRHPGRPGPQQLEKSRA